MNGETRGRTIGKGYEEKRGTQITAVRAKWVRTERN